MSTFQNVLDEVRDNLPETSANAKRWTDASIMRRVNRQLLKLAKTIARISGEWYYTEQDITPPSASADLTLPDGSLYSAIPECNGDISSIFINESRMKHGGLTTQFILPQENCTPSAYRIKASKIYFDGYLKTTDEIRLNYYKRPAVVTVGGVYTGTVDFPKDHLDVLVNMVSALCLQKDNSDNAQSYFQTFTLSYKRMINDLGSARSTQSRQSLKYENEFIRPRGYTTSDEW